MSKKKKLLSKNTGKVICDVLWGPSDIGGGRKAYGIACSDEDDVLIYEDEVVPSSNLSDLLYLGDDDPCQKKPEE